MRLPENAKDDFTKLKEEKAELRRKLDKAESELKASKEIAQRQQKIFKQKEVEFKNTIDIIKQHVAKNKADKVLDCKLEAIEDDTILKVLTNNEML